MFKLPDLDAKQDRAVTVHQTQPERSTQLAEGLRPARQRRKAGRSPLGFGEAYKSVVELHCLIFFLVGADAVGLQEFLTYIVEYLVYFFPWEMIRMFHNLRSAGQQGKSS